MEIEKLVNKIRSSIPFEVGTVFGWTDIPTILFILP